MRTMLLAAALFVGAATAAAAADPAFDPRELRAAVNGAPTQVLVLASPHLAGAGDGFDPASLEPLLGKLAAFKPDLIAVENLSGETLQTLKTYAEVYPELADGFGGAAFKLAAAAKAELGLDMPAAEAEARRTLAAWPASPRAAQRRRLAAVFAAAGDPNSALVQWWRLPPAERRAGDGVSADLAGLLEAHGAKRNETQLVAARLAARLGLERLHPMDDQTDGDLMIPVGERLAEAAAADPDVSAMRRSPELARLRGFSGRLTTPEAALDVYREANSAEAGRLDARLQWGTWLKAGLPDGLGRRRVAAWETRNLRMAAHIREAAGAAPGGRVLVLVGSSHKPYLDAYLALMSDVEVVDAEDVLK